MHTLSERAKLGLLCLLLLLLIGIMAFAAANTFQAVRSFQQQYSAAKAGDIRTIRPWMTIHAISHFYHVPENYLYYSLQIDNPVLLHHVTLYEIAKRKRQPVDQVIHVIQHAILIYRKKLPHTPTPTPTPTQKPTSTPMQNPTPKLTPTRQARVRQPSSMPIRTKY